MKFKPGQSGILAADQRFSANFKSSRDTMLLT